MSESDAAHGDSGCGEVLADGPRRAKFLAHSDVRSNSLDQDDQTVKDSSCVIVLNSRVFSGISLNQLIAELNWAIATKLYMNTNSDTLP